MKKMYVTLLALLLIFLAACGDDSEPEKEAVENMERLVVEIQMDEQIETGETTLQAKANYENEPLEETDRMMFEIWTGENKGNSETVEGEHEGDGVYTATFNFEEDGIYHVQAHVEANDEHVQPVEDIAVGDASLEERETPDEMDEDEE